MCKSDLKFRSDSQNLAHFRNLTIQKFHQLLLKNEIKIANLVEFYLNQIQANSHLNAVISVNPAALKLAQILDEKFARGKFDFKKEPLFGVPVLLKDNIGCVGMPTTAGSMALREFYLGDAFITKRLKIAGAIIIAKANMHEFAVWGESVSSLGGQARNPFDLTRTPGGSSGGTGAGICADLALAGIGTDTVNSIRSPASACGLFGLRPSAGLVSRAGIVPYSATQDIAGPICRSTRDCAVILDVISGRDEHDCATLAWREKPKFSEFNENGNLNGVKIGILRSFFGQDPRIIALCENALTQLKDAGATLIEISQNLDQAWLTQNASIHTDEFQGSLDKFLREFNAPAKSLKEIYESGKFHPSLKPVIEKALNSDENEKIRKLKNAEMVSKTLDEIFAENSLDFLVFPHQQELVCKIGAAQNGRNGVLAAISGRPSVSVPIGFVNEFGQKNPQEFSPNEQENSQKNREISLQKVEIPVGFEILGAKFSDFKALSLAFWMERNLRLIKT